jgi:hypothetical protein
VHREDYRTHAQAKASLFYYIEVFYNRKRRHSEPAPLGIPITSREILGCLGAAWPKLRVANSPNWNVAF